jgi:hypothetical protein
MVQNVPLWFETALNGTKWYKISISIPDYDKFSSNFFVLFRIVIRTFHEKIKLAVHRKSFFASETWYN